MAATSMTGFGRGEINLADRRLSVEIATVNQKNLQVSCYAPEEWATLETLSAPWIRARLVRGKVTVRVTFADLAAKPAVGWDEASVLNTLADLRALAIRAGMPFEPDARLLLQLAESKRATRAPLPPLEHCETAVAAGFAVALEQLVAMREAEGRSLVADLNARLQKIAALVADMEAGEKEAPKKHRAALLKRLQEAGLGLDPADDRVLKELALFADRCDITEEVVRLKSHILQFTNELKVEKSGRKLDFLVQELLREVNTVGSKAAEIPTTKAVLEAKTEIERIREQVQNLE
ncbi:MAG: YicC family protein [Verrucomicrobia bacterium]|nr:YicC family protein [Verrucomicrobiota bacterium]